MTWLILFHLLGLNWSICAVSYLKVAFFFHSSWPSVDALIIFGVLFSVLKHWICQQFTPFLTRLMVSSRSLRISNLIVNWNIKLWTGGKHPRTATAFFSCIFFSFHVVTQFVILKKKRKKHFRSFVSKYWIWGIKTLSCWNTTETGKCSAIKNINALLLFFFFSKLV